MEFLLLFHFTALMLAAQNNNIEIVKLLLSNPSIDVNIVSRIENQFFF